MIAAVISLSLLAAGPAAQRADPVAPRTDSLGADWAPQQDQARSAVRAGRFMPLKSVVAEIGRRIPGHLLDAGIEGEDGGRQVYHVRWAAADGRRIDVFADAVTGAVIRQEGR